MGGHTTLYGAAFAMLKEGGEGLTREETGKWEGRNKSCGKKGRKKIGGKQYNRQGVN